MRCSDFPGSANIKLTINSVTSATTCPDNPIDFIKPTCTTQITPVSWSTGSVIATATCSDTGSGSNVGCSSTNVLVQSITKHNTAAQFVVRDNTGNTGACVSSGAKIDSAAPVI